MKQWFGLASRTCFSILSLRPSFTIWRASSKCTPRTIFQDPEGQEGQKESVYLERHGYAAMLYSFYFEFESAKKPGY